MRVLFGVMMLTMFGGCLSRAPTTYELDRRAGLLRDDARDEMSSRVSTSSAVARAARVPVKLPPLVEKVWVSDLGLGPDARLQGTWLYVVVTPGRWLDEVDPGGAPLLDLEEKGVGGLRERAATSARTTSATSFAPVAN